MSGHLTTVAPRRGATLAIKKTPSLLAAFLTMAFASAAQAQTFNQALQRACNVVPGINCPGTPNSGGSTTALTTESSPIEERKIEIEEQKLRRVVGPFSLFASGEYERFDKDLTTFEPAYTTDIGRVLAGADYAFSDRVTLGGAFRYSREKGNFVGGGRFDTDAYGGLVHANFTPFPQLFLDASAGYTRKDYSLRRVGIFISGNQLPSVGVAKGETDGNEYKVGLAGGYDFRLGTLSLGPRLGLHYRRTEIDGFSERGSARSARLIYDDQNEDSLTSAIGVHASVALSTGFGVLVPQTTLEYVHEFLDDQRNLSFRVPGDPRKFRFENDPPDRNYFNLGAGIVLVLARGISPFVNYRALVGYKDQSSHIVTAGLRVEF